MIAESVCEADINLCERQVVRKAGYGFWQTVNIRDKFYSNVHDTQVSTQNILTNTTSDKTTAYFQDEIFKARTVE